MTRLKYVWMFTIVLFFGLPSVMQAQKKEIAAARDQVKAGKDLNKAQASMEKLLKDSANLGNKKIWVTLFDAVRKQYEQGNEKLYLKQKYDTAQLFNLGRQMFLIAQGLDSVEMVPNRKGKVDIEYRKAHAEYLKRLRPNLYNGGVWFLQKKKYPEAYQFFDLYIDCATKPLFKGNDFQSKNPPLYTAAYWAVYSGYKMKNSRATLHHSYEALKDTVHYNYMLQYLAETYKLDKDTVRYVATLKDGFSKAPKFPFFFPRLVEYYSEKNQLDSAMNVVNQALAVDSLNDIYLFTKSTLLLNLCKYKDCIKVCDQVIAQNDSMPGTYLNAGLAYFNMAVEQDKNLNQSNKQRMQIQSDYKKALPYLEKYREMMPENQDHWALPLYTIYLNLNMGKEFDEIDKLINQSRK